MGKCFRALFGASLGLGALPTLRCHKGCLNLVRFGQIWFAGRGMEVRLERHVNFLNYGRNRMIGNRMDLIHLSVRNGLSLLRVRESESPWGYQGETE
jgi:hypothetical protein